MLKSQMIFKEQPKKVFRAEIPVDYRFEQTVGLLVPVEMTEQYDDLCMSRSDGTFYISFREGKATYSKFRKFMVSTNIASPREPQGNEEKPKNPEENR